MNQGIAKHFTFPQLLKFAFPSIVMMVFTSMYSIVDGFFVSRYVGSDALSAVNIVYPLLGIILAVGIMLATGGSAVVAIKMGEGRTREANKDFSLITLTGVIFGVVLAVVSLIFLKPLVTLLGADARLMDYCVSYLRILLIFSPMSVLQFLFQSFFVAAGKPNLGLGLSIGAGVFNMIFDYVFIVILDMGIVGAALATAGGYCIPALGGVLFFFKNKEGLGFAAPSKHISVLLKSMANGSSEMVSNLAASVTTFLFNIYMMKFAGPDGVAAITAVLYTQFLMTALYIGFSMGVAPVISYNYGAKNIAFLKKVLAKCIGFVGGTSLALMVVFMAGAGVISALFFKPDTEVFALAAHGLRLFSLSVLFAGLNIFASALFTALGDGKVSAGISFSRTLVFTVLGIIGMAAVFGIDGIWLAVPLAEFLTIFVVALCSRKLKRVYLKTE